MYRLIVFIGFLAFTLNANSQKTFSYNEIDSISYLQCLNNDFKGIKKTIKLAEEEQIEFYYLHLRAGIVAYKIGSIEYALIHFRLAVAMNPADPEAQTYLYLSLLNTNRVDDAREYGSTLKEELRTKLSISKENQFAVSIGFLSALNTNISSNENTDFITPDKTGADVILNGNVLGTNFACDIGIKNRTHFYNKFSLFNTKSMAIEQIQYANQNRSSSYSNDHFQYNFGISKTFKNGMNAGIGFGFFHTNFSQMLVRFDNLGIATFKDSTLTYNNISIAGNFGKRIGNFHPLLNINYSNLYGENQFQTEGILIYYPLGNKNLIGSTAFAFVRNGTENQTIFNQKVTIKCLPWLWIDGKFSIGNHMNYMSNLGFVSFNTADPAKNNSGLDVHFYYKKLEFVFGYSYQTREASYTVYPTLTTSESTSYKYKSNNLITTLKWNF
jgi:tetratricopeptide (TPR) repeat protein